MKCTLLIGLVGLVWLFYIALFKAAAKEDRYLQREFEKSINEELNKDIE